MTDFTARAREILKSEPISNYDRDRLAPKIAQAIAEVRREALEEAAEFCDVYHAMEGEGLAVGIRSLKDSK